jgi:uncharacterized membrane protein
MQMCWRSEVPQWLLVTGMFVAAFVAWPFAPDRIPVHWNLVGEVDGYGSKSVGLMVFPLIAAAAYVLFLVMPRFDPGRANYSSFASAYLVIRLSILILLVLSHSFVLRAALGYNANAGSFIPLAIGLLLMVLGNVMGKIRPNWFVGVRTPWTLSSRRSWNKTHRLAGWLCLAMGIVTAVCGLIQTRWMIITVATVIVASLLWIVIYSYVVWREDPDRLSPAEISPHGADKQS